MAFVNIEDITGSQEFTGTLQGTDYLSCIFRDDRSYVLVVRVSLQVRCEFKAQ